MSQVIIFTNENGSVSVCYPSGEMSIEQVKQKDCPANSYIIEETSLPIENNDFFDAWEHTDGVISVNFSKAQEITKNRLRFEREPLLAAQDVLFQRAQETGADITSIVAEKNRLRDITKLVDTCSTLNELRDITP